MMQPVIPIDRTVCVTCAAKLAWVGERECGDCLFETRFAAWALAEGELPPGLRFVGDGDTKTFAPVGYRPGAAGAVPVYEDPEFATPRITEVSLPQSPQANAVARRVASVVGVLLLWACATGWVFGRYCR